MMFSSAHKLNTSDESQEIKKYNIIFGGKTILK
jgi:hypothetical protein